MPWNSELKRKHQQQYREAEQGGGEERLEKVHAAGKLSARERLELLFDKGYEELEIYRKSRIEAEGIQKKHYYGDGVVCASGLVNGVRVFAASQDSTVSAGAGGEAHVDKICRTLRLAIETHSPMVFLCDSGGARIEEGILSLAAYSRLFFLNTQASGLIPQISAIMGNCAGGSSYSPAMCDFLFMVKETGQMFITGPRVIRALTGETVTMNELGGSQVHSTYSGQAHFVAENDIDCIQQIRALLAYLTIPKIAFSGIHLRDYHKLGMEIENIVPENNKKVYDVRTVIQQLSDEGKFLEVLQGFAKNIVTGFCRLDGRSVGVVANQPSVMGGALNCDASDKCARFVRTCDSLEIPLLVLVDVPGFFPGKTEEQRGILRHGCKILYAFSEATVPKITVIMRKAYGGAYCAMNSKDIGADIVFAWPICEIAVMGADGAVDILFRKQIAESDSPDTVTEQLISGYKDKYLSPYYAASLGMIDEVILPEETRDKVIQGFQLLEGKQIRRISKKHGNIAL